MRKEEASNNVKLAATNALLNSLEFTKANFDKEVRKDTCARTHTHAPLPLPARGQLGAQTHLALGTTCNYPEPLTEHLAPFYRALPCRITTKAT